MVSRRALTLLAASLLLAGCKKDPPEPTAQEQAEGYYLKGNAEFLQGNHDAALAAFEEVRKRVPNDPRLPAAIGEVYLLQGRWPEARLQFQEAVRQDPKRATNWSRLALVQATQKDQAAARESLDKALALNPRDFNALEQLAEVVQVRALAQEAPTPDGGRQPGYEGGLVEQAAQLWKRAAMAAPDYRQGDLYLNAYRLLLSAGRAGQAQQLLHDAADAGTSAPEVYATLGELQVVNHDFEAAAASYERAAKHGSVTPRPDGGVSGDSTYWEFAGRLYTRLDQLGKAKAAYGQAVVLDDRAVLHVALARLALLRGDERGARAELDRALSTYGGAEARETIEVADLLAELGRREDALLLLKDHASAEDGAEDLELQIVTARLAKQVGDAATQKAACARALKLDQARRTEKDSHSQPSIPGQTVITPGVVLELSGCQ